MKVWHLISNRWNSAISEYALSAAKALRLAGADTLVTCLSESPIESRFKLAGFVLNPVDGFGPGRYSKLAGIAKHFSPEVVFTYGGPETTATLFFKGKAKLFRFYGYNTTSQSPIQLTTRRLGHLHVDCMVTPSLGIAQGLKDQVSCPVVSVPLGIDTTMFEFKDLVRSERPELLIFGRIDPVKGHREFMNLFLKVLALSELHGSPRPRLKIVGVPANLSKVHLLEHAKSIGLSSNDFELQCDRVNNVAELMSKVSVGVVSSLGSEAICRVAQEFLLCGTPIVSTAVGSLSEVFSKPEFGSCYGSHENDAAAQIIFDILMMSHEETNVVRQARAIAARSEFSIDTMSQRLSASLFGQGTAS